MFQALGLENSDSLTKFVKNLELLAHCSHCEDEKIIEIHRKGNAQTISTVGSPSPSNDSNESSFSVPNNAEGKIENVSLDLDLMRRIEHLNRNAKPFPIETKSGPIHELSVNYAHILSALEMTIKHMARDTLNGSDNETTRSNISALCIDPEQRKDQIELMWTNYRTMFPAEHANMWSSLEYGLADYLVHLKKREKLHTECDKLRRQNAQLKYMLQEVLQAN